MKIFVVVDPQNGWDNIKGIYQANSKIEVKIALLEEQGYTLEIEPKDWEDNNFIHYPRELIRLK